MAIVLAKAGNFKSAANIHPFTIFITYIVDLSRPSSPADGVSQNVFSIAKCIGPILFFAEL